jgi:hypothetical protein
MITLASRPSKASFSWLYFPSLLPALLPPLPKRSPSPSRTKLPGSGPSQPTFGLLSGIYAQHTFQRSSTWISSPSTGCDYASQNMTRRVRNRAVFPIFQPRPLAIPSRSNPPLPLCQAPRLAFPFYPYSGRISWAFLLPSSSLLRVCPTSSQMSSISGAPHAARDLCLPASKPTSSHALTILRPERSNGRCRCCR